MTFIFPLTTQHLNFFPSFRRVADRTHGLAHAKHASSVLEESISPWTLVVKGPPFTFPASLAGGAQAIPNQASVKDSDSRPGDTGGKGWEIRFSPLGSSGGSGCRGLLGMGAAAEVLGWKWGGSTCAAVPIARLSTSPALSDDVLTDHSVHAAGLHQNLPVRADRYRRRSGVLAESLTWNECGRDEQVLVNRTLPTQESWCLCGLKIPYPYMELIFKTHIHLYVNGKKKSQK